jgi:hypothetical protein
MNRIGIKIDLDTGNLVSSAGRGRQVPQTIANSNDTFVFIGTEVSSSNAAVRLRLLKAAEARATVSRLSADCDRFFEEYCSFRHCGPLAPAEVL